MKCGIPRASARIVALEGGSGEAASFRVYKNLHLKRPGPHDNGRSSPEADINHEKDMPLDPTEIHAKATIAAALIASHAVEVPRLPTHRSDWGKDSASVRLRDLTDFVYRTIVGNQETLAPTESKTVRSGT